MGYISKALGAASFPAPGGGERTIPVNVALFVTCLVDLMRPRIAFSAIALLEHAGCRVTVPSAQTCCGQPAFNSGDRVAAAALARKTIAEFEGFDYVVAPSGSCADQIRTEYPALLADDPAWATRATVLAGRTYELTDFLAGVVRLDTLPARPAAGEAGSIAYHDSCTGLRSLGIKEQPRRLLALLKDATTVDLAGCEECCGFGGTFAVKYGDVSAAIAERKCDNILASGAGIVAGGDLGCLLNIEGKLHRMGNTSIAVRHVAELLAPED